MFCPDGFIHWGDLCEMVDYWASTVIGIECLASKGPIPPSAFSKSGYYSSQAMNAPDILGPRNTEQRHGQPRFIQALLEWWMVANFSQQHVPFICSPEGTVLKTSWWTTRHADQLDWCPWSWPPQKNSAFSSYFRNFQENGFSGDDIAARFPYVDANTGVISLKNNSETLLRDAICGGGSCENIKPIIKANFQPFLGWSLCWKEDDLPETLEEILDGFGLVGEHWRHILEEDIGPKTSSSNFRNPKDVIDCILTAYPNGKGSATWDSVETKVGYSRRHILRVLENDPEHYSWANTGHR